MFNRNLKKKLFYFSYFFIYRFCFVFYYYKYFWDFFLLYKKLNIMRIIFLILRGILIYLNIKRVIKSKEKIDKTSSNYKEV